MVKKKVDVSSELKCDECDKTYKTQRGLDQHKLSLHPKKEVPKKVTPKKEVPKKAAPKKAAPKKAAPKKAAPKKEAPKEILKDILKEIPKEEPPKDEKVSEEAEIPIKKKKAPAAPSSTKPNNFVCPFVGCGESFETKALALDHIEKIHRNKVEEKPKAKEEAPVSNTPETFSVVVSDTVVEEHIPEAVTVSEPEPEPEEVVDYTIPHITHVLPPKPTKSYGRADFMFKGKKRVQK